MLTSEATVTVDRPGRYLAQFCRHAAAMGRTGGGHRSPGHAGRAALARGELQIHSEHTETHGVVTISPWGRCTLHATTDTTLVLRVDATDQDAMLRLRDIVTRDLERFGRREGLTVSWQQPRPSDIDPDEQEGGAMPSLATTPTRSGRRPALLVAVLIGAAIAAHVILGTAVLANARWVNLSVDVVLAIALVKSLLIAFGGRALRARMKAGARRHAGMRHHGGPGAAIPAGDPALAGDGATGDERR